MIETKVENRKAEVVLKPEADIKIQDEIVQMIVSSLLAFKDRIRKDGLNVDDADKDADIILNRAAQVYHSIKNNIANENNVKPIGPIAKPYDPMADVMRQVDEILNGKHSPYEGLS